MTEEFVEGREDADFQVEDHVGLMLSTLKETLEDHRLSVGLPSTEHAHELGFIERSKELLKHLEKEGLEEQIITLIKGGTTHD